MNRFPPRKGPWRPQGAPYYLDGVAERLGISPVLVIGSRVQGNTHLVRIAGQCREACQNFFEARRNGAGWSESQLDHVRAILSHCEAEIAKTHAIAAAATDMTDEAYRAFGLEPPVRRFRVHVQSDAGPVFTADARLTVEESDAVRAERDAAVHEARRLRAENDALTEQLTAPDGSAPDKRTSSSRTPAKV